MSALKVRAMIDSGVMAKFIRSPSSHWVEMARACQGMHLTALSSQEKFAIAVCAGVEIRDAVSDGQGGLTFTTAPCQIREDGMGGFVVTTKE